MYDSNNHPDCMTKNFKKIENVRFFKNHCDYKSSCIWARNQNIQKAKYTGLSFYGNDAHTLIGMYMCTYPHFVVEYILFG